MCFQLIKMRRIDLNTPSYFFSSLCALFFFSIIDACFCFLLELCFQVSALVVALVSDGVLEVCFYCCFQVTKLYHFLFC